MGIINKILTICFIIATHVAFGGQSKLKHIFTQYNNSKGVEATFQVASQSFLLKSYGPKFILKNDITHILFDGNHLYTYNQESNEVVIEELKEDSFLLNPTNIFSLNLSLFSIENGGENYILTPKERMDGVENITLTISKDGQLKGVLLLLEDGNVIEILFSELRFSSSVDTTQFKFNKKLYKGAEIIDFR